MAAMNNNPQMKARRIFRKLGVCFEDLDKFSYLLSDVQTCLAVSLHENFSRLPKKTSSEYGDKIQDGVLIYQRFLCDRMEGLVEELNGMIDQVHGDECHVAAHDVVFVGGDTKVLRLSDSKEI